MQKSAPQMSTPALLVSAHIFSSAVREVFGAAVLSEVAGEKLSATQLKLLYFAAKADRHTIGDAAGFLRVSNAAASKAVDKLVRLKLLRRTREQQDRRACHISATEAGRRLIAAYETARHKMASRVFGRFSAHELRKTAQLLDRLAAAIVRHGTRPAGICLQCEVCYRASCRFAALSRRTCVYKFNKSKKQGALEPGSNEL